MPGAVNTSPAAATRHGVTGVTGFYQVYQVLPERPEEKDVRRQHGHYRRATQGQQYTNSTSTTRIFRRSSCSVSHVKQHSQRQPIL